MILHLEIDDSVFKDLNDLKHSHVGSLEDIAASLLTDPIKRIRQPPPVPPLDWATSDMKALVDITDKDLLHRALNTP